MVKKISEGKIEGGQDGVVGWEHVCSSDGNMSPATGYECVLKGNGVGERMVTDGVNSRQ